MRRIELLNIPPGTRMLLLPGGTPVILIAVGPKFAYVKFEGTKHERPVLFKRLVLGPELRC